MPKFLVTLLEIEYLPMFLCMRFHLDWVCYFFKFITSHVILDSQARGTFTRN